MNKKSLITGNLAALYSILIWGTTFVVTKNLMNSFNAAEILLSRFIIAFLVLCLIRTFMGKEKMPEKRSRKDELLFVGTGLTGLLLYGILEILSMRYTYASNTSTIISTDPFFVAVFTMIFLKGEKKPGANFFIGFVVAISGIAILSFNGATNFGLNPLGDALALLCAIAWGFYTVIVKTASNKGYETTYITRHTYFWGMIFMAVCLPIMGTEGGVERFANKTAILSLLFLGVFASCTCFLAFNYATKAIGPVNSGIYIYGIPIITILFSCIFLNEKVNAFSLLGIALAIAGTLISTIKKKQK